MELSREEWKLKQSHNWGAQTFNNLKKRHAGTKVIVAPKKSIRAALEDHPIVNGPLNANDIIGRLTESEQCDFFMRFTNCKTLILQGWSNLTDNVIRSISLSMGENLTELDISGSNIDKEKFDILFGRLRSLRVLKISSCSNIDGHCMATLASTSHKTLKELHADSCSLFRLEPLLWMAGTVGINSQKLGKLMCLNLANCPLEDRALIAISEGLTQIKQLNIEECIEVTDVGFSAIGRNLKQLEVINAAGCVLITSRSLTVMSKNCLKLVSCNFNRCYKVTDQGVKSLSNKCIYLQALNIAGIRTISEDTLCSIAMNCKGILMLNVTGCEDVTSSGLKALIMGLPFVEEAKTYFGFKPIDEHVDKKLACQLSMNRDAAAIVITHNMKIVQEKQKVRHEYAIERIDNASRVIQSYFRRYMCRLRFYYMHMTKIYSSNANTIQRVWRGVVGRRKATKKREENLDLLAKTPHAVLIQKMFRGQRSRFNNRYIADTIRGFYEMRNKEAEVGIAVRFQSYSRRFLACKRIDAWREYVHRRRKDEFNAAAIIQCMIRCFLAKTNKIKRSNKKKLLTDLRNRSASRIQAFYRACHGKYSAALSGKELLMIKRKRLAATINLQKHMRGHWGRRAVYKLRIQNTLSYCAAREIQRVYRGRRVMGWRDMRMNIIASFVLDRQYIERQDRVNAARLRYQAYLHDVKKDSASDSNDEESTSTTTWSYVYDDILQVEKWINILTSEVVFEEPADPEALVKSLVGVRLRILWVVQNEWYEGTVTQYRFRKKKHRVEYDDGDYEWINLITEHERVQIKIDDDKWIMLSLYQPDAIKHEMTKLELKQQNNKLKQNAFKDANQWRIITDDKKDEVVMYISDISGIIRTGSASCRNWVVVDDGFGYPCFLNTVTSKRVFEDPRFSEDVNEDLQYQRDYVMQELRLSMYFCKDIYGKYENAVYMKNKKRLQSVLKTAISSNKPKLLTAFLIRAKSLYQQISVVDIPVDPSIVKELEYAAWLAAKISEIMDEGWNLVREYRTSKQNIIQNVMSKKSKYITKYTAPVVDEKAYIEVNDESEDPPLAPRQDEFSNDVAELGFE